MQGIAWDGVLNLGARVDWLSGVQEHCRPIGGFQNSRDNALSCPTRLKYHLEVRGSLVAQVTGFEEGVVQARVVEVVLGLFDRAGYAVLVVHPAGHPLAHNERFGRRALSERGLLELPKPSLLEEGVRQALTDGLARFETEQPPLLRPDGARWRVQFIPFGRGAESCIAVIYEPMSGAHPGPAASLDERFRTLVDGALEGMLICRGSMVLFANRAAAGLIGHAEASAVVGLELQECLGERTSAWVSRMDGAFDATGTLEVESEIVIRTRGGVERDAIARLIQVRGGNHTEPRIRLLFFWIPELLTWQAPVFGTSAMATLLDAARRWGEELGVLQQLVERVASGSNSGGTLNLGELWNEVSDGFDRLRGRIARPAWCDERRDQPVWIEQLVAALVSSDGRLLNARDVALSGVEVLVDVESSICPLAGSEGACVAAVQCLVGYAGSTLGPSRPLWIRGLRDRGGGRPSRYILQVGPDRDLRSEEMHDQGPIEVAWDLGSSLDGAYACAVLEQGGHRVRLLSGPDGVRTVVVDFLLDEGRRVEMQGSAMTRHTVVPSTQCLGQTAEQPAPPLTVKESSAPEASRCRVLICDDEARLLQLTQSLLEEFGYEVVTATSGREALERFIEQPCEVLMLDVSLPEENPWDVAEGLRLTGCPVNVLLCSGYSEEDIDPVLLRHPLVRAFLGKPYAVDLLVSTIERLAERDSTGACDSPKRPTI